VSTPRSVQLSAQLPAAYRLGTGWFVVFSLHFGYDYMTLLSVDPLYFNSIALAQV